MLNFNEDNFIFKNKLGEGVFSKVFLCRNIDNNKNYAVKQIKPNKNKGFLKSALKEIDIYKQFENKSEFIIDFIGFFYCKNKLIHLVFETMDMNLYEYQKEKSPLHINYCIKFTYQICKGIEYLHKYIIHRDLKQENIMIDLSNQNLKIIDLGSSAVLKENNYDNTNCYQVSRYYRAPEIVYGMNYNKSIDIWSIACILFELIVDYPLFKSKCQQDLIYKISELIGIPGKEYKLSPKYFKYWIYKINLYDNLKKKISKNKEYINDEESFDYEYRHSIFTENIKYKIPRKKNVIPFLYSRLQSNIKNKITLKHTVDFISKIIIYDSQKRLTSEECLNHLLFLEYKINPYKFI